MILIHGNSKFKKTIVENKMDAFLIIEKSQEEQENMMNKALSLIKKFEEKYDIKILNPEYALTMEIGETESNLFKCNISNNNTVIDNLDFYIMTDASVDNVFKTIRLENIDYSTEEIENFKTKIVNELSQYAEVTNNANLTFLGKDIDENANIFIISENGISAVVSLNSNEKINIESNKEKIEIQKTTNIPVEKRQEMIKQLKQRITNYDYSNINIGEEIISSIECIYAKENYDYKFIMTDIYGNKYYIETDTNLAIYNISKIEETKSEEEILEIKQMIINKLNNEQGYNFNANSLRYIGDGYYDVYFELQDSEMQGVISFNDYNCGVSTSYNNNPMDEQIVKEKMVEEFNEKLKSSEMDSITYDDVESVQFIEGNDENECYYICSLRDGTKYLLRITNWEWNEVNKLTIEQFTESEDLFYKEKIKNWLKKNNYTFSENSVFEYVGNKWWDTKVYTLKDDENGIMGCIELRNWQAYENIYSSEEAVNEPDNNDIKQNILNYMNDTNNTNEYKANYIPDDVINEIIIESSITESDGSERYFIIASDNQGKKYNVDLHEKNGYVNIDEINSNSAYDSKKTSEIKDNIISMMNKFYSNQNNITGNMDYIFFYYGVDMFKFVDQDNNQYLIKYEDHTENEEYEVDLYNAVNTLALKLFFVADDDKNNEEMPDSYYEIDANAQSQIKDALILIAQKGLEEEDIQKGYLEFDEELAEKVKKYNEQLEAYYSTMIDFDELTTKLKEFMDYNKKFVFRPILYRKN